LAAALIVFSLLIVIFKLGGGIGTAVRDNR